MPAPKGHKYNPTGKGGFKKGSCPNPGGRPKGSLNKSTIAMAMIEGLRQATKKKTGEAAISFAIRDDVEQGIITKSEAVSLISKFLPQEITGAGGKDLIPSRYNLSALSTAELLAFKKLQEKIEIKEN
jgi:hypothetical protein